jgi:hypothetical protein
MLSSDVLPLGEEDRSCIKRSFYGMNRNGFAWVTQHKPRYVTVLHMLNDIEASTSAPLPLLVSRALDKERCSTILSSDCFLRAYVRLAGQTHERHERHARGEKDSDPSVCRRRSLNNIRSPLMAFLFRFLWRIHQSLSRCRKATVNPTS